LGCVLSGNLKRATIFIRRRDVAFVFEMVASVLVPTAIATVVKMGKKPGNTRLIKLRHLFGVDRLGVTTLLMSK